MCEEHVNRQLTVGIAFDALPDVQQQGQSALHLSRAVALRSLNNLFAPIDVDQ